MHTSIAQIMQTANALSPEEKLQVIEQLAYFLKQEPLPPSEVAAHGLLGVWAYQGIADGAEWVNDQKQKV